MTVLPLLTLPFLTLAFWAMGGGKGNAQGNRPIGQAGLNLQLPEPKLEDESKENKLSFYDKAQEDSIKRRQEMQNDPYYKNGIEGMKIPENISMNSIKPSSGDKLIQSPNYPSGTTTSNEAKIYERLDALNKAIQNPTETSKEDVASVGLKQDNSKGDLSTDVDRLENMMTVMNEKGTDDPEMKQLGNMLDKILDIQHPERVKDRIKEKSLTSKQTVFHISKMPKEQNISLIDTGKGITSGQSGFFGVDDEGAPDVENNAIEAVVNESQVLVNGAVVKFRLLNDLYVHDALIPTGTFVFGVASLNGERLEIDINSIRYHQSLYPVKLQVYDIDGLSGIYIPGAITRDVAKQSVDNSLQLLELSSMDPSVKAQATAAGIDAAKNLLSKKVKQIKVVVKAGYRVLLKDKSTQ